MRAIILTLIVAGGLELWSAEPIAAQSLQIGGSNSNYGSVTLAAGFTPDPHQVTVTSGGSLDVRAMNLGAGCVGYATSQPDFILHLSSSSTRLRFYNTGGGDTGLLINDASGRWHCNDDSYGGTNPTVTISDAPPGQYDVWVSSYQSGENIPSTLYITELDRHPGSDGDSYSGGSSTRSLTIAGSDAYFGNVTLAPGFRPDPHQVTVTSGGSLDVRAMNLGPGCVGHAAQQPDFILHLTGRSSMLRFYVVGDGDTGLVVNDGTGSWHCDDDSYGGTNPEVTIYGAPSGQYDVWVTSYRSGQDIRGTLYVSELAEQRPKGK
ncbi:MAG: peptidase [Gemmatimonadota bacterium]|nr:MAG: peptidase [Gemmatimonadota bacterium]